MEIIKQSLQLKLILIMTSLFIIIGLTDFIVKEKVIYPSFYKIEQQEASKNLQRATGAIDRLLLDISHRTDDWSSWTDTFEYVQNPTKDYEDSNLVDATFTSYQLQLIFLLNNKNKVVWGKIFSPDFEKEVELSAFNKTKLPDNHPTLQFENVNRLTAITGVLTTEYGPMLIVSRLIYNSDEVGPSTGTFIMGKFLTTKTLTELADQIQIPFKIILPSDITFNPISTELNKHKDKYIETFEHELKAYAGYSDFFSKKAFIIETQFSRDITEKGISALRFSSSIMIIASLILLIMILFFLRQLILNPMLLMTNFLHQLNKHRDFNAQVPINRSDEIGILVDGLNDMCKTIAEQTNLLEGINSKLEIDSSTDALTGIANRRAFDRAYYRYWAMSFREQKSFALIIADIDFFKLYNDTYGHQKGDISLKGVAEGISQCLRKNDFVARYGGEEFVLILPSTNLEGAKKVAKMVIDTVENLKIPHKNSIVGNTLTISLGGAVTIPTQELSAEKFFDIVDKILYQSKEKGRNQAHIIQVENYNRETTELL